MELIKKSTKKKSKHILYRIDIDILEYNVTKMLEITYFFNVTRISDYFF